MKIIATILLVCFSSFLAEAVILPNKNITVDKASVHHCCGQCKKMQQQTANKDNSKGCNQSCINCPVFAIFYADHIKATLIISPVFEIQYNTFSDRCVSSYIADSWKPPNAL